MSKEFERQSEEPVTRGLENAESGEVLPKPMVHIGLEERSLHPEIKEILQERDIPYRLIPMTDMWRGSPQLFRVEKDENGKKVEKEIARGVTDTIRRLRSDEFTGTLSDDERSSDE